MHNTDNLQPNQGEVTIVNDQQVAIYKKPDGSVVYLSPRCTHMGCTVDWNGSEKTWDCPCHGSRFTAEGKVKQGPAQRDLQAVQPPEE